MRSPADTAPPMRRRFAASIALAVLCSAWLGVVFVLLRETFVDDAYISFRYLQNLLDGQGLVFNRGVRVEGLTNLGWVLFLWPLTALFEIPLASKVAGVALVALSLVALPLITRKLLAHSDFEGPRSLPLAPLALSAVSIDFLFFSLAGMETALAAALGLVAVLLCDRRFGLEWSAVLGAAVYLVRPELGLVFPLFVVGLLATKTASWSELRAPAGLFGVLIAGVTVFRLAYFGRALPNTFYAKSVAPADWLGHLASFAHGGHWNLAAPVEDPLFLAVVLYGCWTIRAAGRPALFVASLVASSFLFALYAEPDWTEMGRYFAPAVPTAWVLFCCGFASAARVLLNAAGRERWLRAAVGAVVVALLAGGIHRSLQTLSVETADEFPGYILTGWPLVPAAEWITGNTPAQATIATRRIGVLAYQSRRDIFDYKFGLAEPEVAELIARAGRNFDDPREPALADLWRERAPDYLLEDGDFVEDLVRPGESLEDFEIQGFHYGVARRFPLAAGSAEWVLCRRIR